MKRLPVTELENRLSHYLRLVKRGETIEVLDRRVPVARLTGVEPGSADEEALLRRLTSDGLVSAPRGKPYKCFLEIPPVPCPTDAVRVLIEERGEG